MRYSQSLIKTFKETPSQADNISSSFLLRGGFIDQEMAGIYSLLPLGLKVIQKIGDIIREEMNAIGGQEIMMPALQPKELWEETERWDKMDPPLFKVKDRHEKDMALGSTHEEVITDIVRDRISTYRDLPQMFYQIQTKFRNEQRSTGGLLRTREFLMKDAYSFHADHEDFEKYYEKVAEAYHRIFEKVGVEVRMVEAHSGSIGGKRSNEFMILSKTGQDDVFICGSCDYAVNAELTTDIKACPACAGAIKSANAIEVAHIFDLGDLYSTKMNGLFTDKNGKQKPYFMGCYGIGIPRLAAAIVEVNHDNNGIIWPESVAPYQVYLVELGEQKAAKAYEEMEKAGIEVLYDDRSESAGVKFSTADLLGIPWRVIVSEKTGDKIEVKKRDSEKSTLIELDKLIDELRK